MTVSFWTSSRNPQKVKTTKQVSPLLKNRPLLMAKKPARLLLNRQAKKKSSTSLTNSSRNPLSPAEHTTVLWNRTCLSWKEKTLLLSSWRKNPALKVWNSSPPSFSVVSTNHCKSKISPFRKSKLAIFGFSGKCSMSRRMAQYTPKLHSSNVCLRSYSKCLTTEIGSRSGTFSGSMKGIFWPKASSM